MHYSLTHRRGENVPILLTYLKCEERATTTEGRGLDWDYPVKAILELSLDLLIVDGYSTTKS